MLIGLAGGGLMSVAGTAPVTRGIALGGGSARARGGSAPCARAAAAAAASRRSSSNASGAAVVAFLWRPGAAATTTSGSPIMPSRTVITFAQFLQRILRILPRTRSSPIE